MRIKSASFAIRLVAGLAAVVAVGTWRYAERSRVIEGTWLYVFEGSEFFEQKFIGQNCRFSHDEAGWLNYDIRQIYPNDDDYERSFPNVGTYHSGGGQWPMGAFEVRFEGRKRFTPWGGGHLSMWKSEYDVDRVLSAKPIPRVNCYVDGWP